MSKKQTKQAKKMIKLGDTIVCQNCGRQIVKEHPYQDYCSECSHKVMREKNTAAVRRFRDRKKKELEEMKKRLAELEQLAQQQQVNDTAADGTDATDATDGSDS